MSDLPSPTEGYDDSNKEVESPEVEETEPLPQTSTEGVSGGSAGFSIELRQQQVTPKQLTRSKLKSEGGDLLPTGTLSDALNRKRRRAIDRQKQTEQTAPSAAHRELFGDEPPSESNISEEFEYSGDECEKDASDEGSGIGNGQDYTILIDPNKIDEQPSESGNSEVGVPDLLGDISLSINEPRINVFGGHFR